MIFLARSPCAVRASLFAPVSCVVGAVALLLQVSIGMGTDSARRHIQRHASGGSGGLAGAAGFAGAYGGQGGHAGSYHGMSTRGGTSAAYGGQSNGGRTSAGGFAHTGGRVMGIGGK
jgi:hypothetical protein